MPKRSSLTCARSLPPINKLAAKNRTARASLHGPPGGLFGIDQEVVTLRGLYGNSGSYYGSPGATDAGIKSKTHRLVLRAVAAWRVSARQPRLEQPALSLSHLTWS